MSEVVIRRAAGADLAAIVRLRREWSHEQDGDREDSRFAERFADWFEGESSHRISWPAETDRRPIGMMNLAIFERMPRPGLRRAAGDTSATHSFWRPTATKALAGNSSAPCLTTRTRAASPASC